MRKTSLFIIFTIFIFSFSSGFVNATPGETGNGGGGKGNVLTSGDVSPSSPSKPRAD